MEADDHSMVVWSIRIEAMMSSLCESSPLGACLLTTLCQQTE